VATAKQKTSKQRDMSGNLNLTQCGLPSGNLTEVAATVASAVVNVTGTGGGNEMLRMFGSVAPMVAPAMSAMTFAAGLLGLFSVVCLC
jgi:hypothetical protein